MNNISPTTGDIIPTCRVYPPLKRLGGGCAFGSFGVSKIIYVIFLTLFLLESFIDKIDFSDVLVAHLREMYTTLFCLFTPYHITRFVSLKGSISTATAVPTLPESFAQRSPLFRLFQSRLVCRSRNVPLTLGITSSE